MEVIFKCKEFILYKRCAGICDTYIYRIDSSSNEDMPFNCQGEYYESVCDGCSYLETEKIQHPGGGLCMVDKYRCGWGFWENDF